MRPLLVGPSPSVPLTFARFSSGSDYSASASSFPLFLAPPHSGFPSAPPPLSLPRLSPFSPAWFPMPSFPVLVLGSLFVSFRPSQLRSHSCSTGASLMLSLSGFPLPLRSLSLASLPVLTTQTSVFPFPASRSPLTAVPTVRSGSFRPLRFSSSVRPVSMPSFRFRYSASCNSFLRFTASCHRHFRSCRPPVSSSAVPLGFRFRFRLLGLSVRTFRFASDLAYITTGTTICQHLFFIFFNYYIVFYNQLVSIYQFHNVF